MFRSKKEVIDFAISLPPGSEIVVLASCPGSGLCATGTDEDNLEYFVEMFNQVFKASNYPPKDEKRPPIYD